MTDSALWGDSRCCRQLVIVKGTGEGEETPLTTLRPITIFCNYSLGTEVH